MLLRREIDLLFYHSKFNGFLIKNNTRFKVVYRADSSCLIIILVICKNKLLEAMAQTLMSHQSCRLRVPSARVRTEASVLLCMNTTTSNARVLQDTRERNVKKVSFKLISVNNDPNFL